jgi:hypothetical protein
MKQKKNNKENVHIEMTMKSFVHFSKVVQKWNNENSAREKESKKERGLSSGDNEKITNDNKIEA